MSTHPEVSRLLELHPGLEVRLCRDGEALIREGEASQEIFLLLDGALVVERRSALPDTPPVVLACLTSEEGPVIVGEMAYLGAFERTASVRSSGLSRALVLEPAHVDSILEGFPMLTRMICRQFSHRLKETLEALSRFQSRFAMTPTRRMAQDGEVLFTQGEPATALYQLMAGTIRLERGGATEAFTAETLPQGFLDLSAYLEGGPHSGTATVDGMAFLAVLEARDRVTVVRTFPELVLAILEQAAP